VNSSTLKGYLTGLILGDGYIDNGTRKRSFRIKSINYDFIEQIQYDLKKSTNFKIVVKKHPACIGRDGTNHKKYWELTVASHPYFSKIYHYFYNDYRKRILSTKALSWLNWAGWANWFMSDGYIVKVGLTKGKIVDRRVEIATDRYGKKNVENLKAFILNNLGYKTSVVKRQKTHRIRMSLLDAQYFLYNISPYVTPSMMYKLDMAYTERPRWMCDEYYLLMKNIHSASPQNFWVKK